MKILRKWLFRAVALVLVVLGCAFGWALSQAERTEHPVGFQVVRADGGIAGKMAIAVWYPTDASPRPTTLLGASLMSVAWNGPVKGKGLPLIVISHGNGGGPGSHVDLAMALADAGYVVAAPMHPGDNIEDQSGIANPGFWAGRNLQLRNTISFMLQDWQGRAAIDRARIGAFGFSAGGFTVLTAIGGQPDLGNVPGYCLRHREFVCDLLRQVKSPLLGMGAAIEGSGISSDPRIKAAVLAAPGLGFTMADPSTLRSVAIPVQLWVGDADDRAPAASNADLIRSALPRPPEFHLGAGAGHLSFLAPCRLIRPSAFCSEQGDFDRAAFHQQMNREVLRFFAANLR